MQSEGDGDDVVEEVCYLTTRRTIKTTQVHETTSEEVLGRPSTGPSVLHISNLLNTPSSSTSISTSTSSSSCSSSCSSTSSSSSSTSSFAYPHLLAPISLGSPASSSHRGGSPCVRPNLPPLILTLRQLAQDRDGLSNAPPLPGHDQDSPMPSWGSATDHRDYHSPGRPYSPIDSSSSPGHCCLLPSLPPLATLLASSPPLPPHSCTTTAYGHNRVVTDSPDRHRRFSHPLPLGTSTSPCMRSSSTSSQSLQWVTETTEDERGKTSVTSFAVGDPPHSKIDKGDLKRKSGEKWEVWIQEYSDLPPQKRPSFAAEGGKRIPSHMRRNLPCEGCGTTETCQWRRGPKGTTTLCNACGLCYARNLAKPGAAGKGTKGKHSPDGSGDASPSDAITFLPSEPPGAADQKTRRHTTAG